MVGRPGRTGGPWQSLENRLAVRQKPITRGAQRPEALDDDVHRQAMQPRGERRLAAKRPELLPDANEHVLGQLVGRIRAGHAPREVVHTAQMGLVYALERARIPLSRKGDIVHRHII